MKYLAQGQESETRFNLILSATKISSEAVKGALHDHLVLGFSDSNAAQMNHIALSNFNRGLATLNAMAEIIEKVKEHDWDRFNYKSVK
jgi:hypothetical protein